MGTIIILKNVNSFRVFGRLEQRVCWTLNMLHISPILAKHFSLRYRFTIKMHAETHLVLHVKRSLKLSQN